MENLNRVKLTIFTFLFLATFQVAPLHADPQIDSATQTSGSSEPVKLIFDTDMDSDCDDTGALAMLHALADNGDVDILAVMISSRNEYSASAADVINTYYGRGDIPIGQVQDGFHKNSLYTELLASQFEHDVTRDSCPDAVSLYRQILSQAADSSIVIATVGYLTNLEHLLKSEPDAHSPLNGHDLVVQKVKKYVCMGSRYPGRSDIGGLGGNFKPDPEAVDYVVNNWPTPIHFTGGGDFAWQCATGDRMDETPEYNPVRVAYKEFLAKNSWTKNYDPTRTKLHSADQIAVWVAVKGIAPFFTQVTYGYNFIYEDGSHEWMTDRDDPNQRYTSGFADGVTAEQVSEAFNDLMVQLPLGAHFYPNSRVGWLPFEAEFDAGISNPGLNATITDFSWNFGDGHTANGENVSHLYENAGSYKVDLTITTDKGDTFSRSDSLVVYDPTFSAVDYYGSALAFERIQENLWSTRMDNDNLTYYLSNADRDDDVDFPGFCFVKDTVFSDFTLTYTARTGEDLSENRSPDYRILFGVQDAENYTYIDMRKSGGRMMQYIDGDRSSLARLSAAMPDDQYHTVTIVKQGDALNAYLDGELLFSYTGPEMQVEGKLGFGSRSDAMYFDDIMISHQVTHVAQPKTNLPHAFALMQNYPNPFNPNTQIQFTLAQAGQIRLTVYNALGREVATLADGHYTAGLHSVTFDASTLSSSVYYYFLETANHQAVRKMLLIR